MTDTGFASIDAVDWRALVARCWDVDPASDDAAQLVAELGGDLVAVESGLVASVRRRVRNRGMAQLGEDLAAAGSESPDALAVWLSAAVEAVVVEHRVADGGGGVTDLAHITAATALADLAAELDIPGPLLMTPDVAAVHLPLLDLARAVGAAHKLGRLVVGTAELGGKTEGTFSPAECVVVLDASVLRDVATASTTWAHELSHAVDAATGGMRAGFRTSELFAQALGPQLLQHQPATIEEAVALAGTSRPGAEFAGIDVPRAGPESAIAVRFIAADLLPARVAVAS